MSYTLALKKAGAEILAEKYFGSYQGDWWTKVIYRGKTGWVHGAFGSCSYCDSFQSMSDSFDRWHHNKYTDMEYPVEGCEICQQFTDRLIAFGNSYLDDILTQVEAEEYCRKNLDWDMEASKMLAWVQANA